MIELLRSAVLIRNDVSIRDNRNCALLLKMLVAMGVRDRANRIHIDRTSERATLLAEGDGWHAELVPPPLHLVDELYTLLAVDRKPWYSRLVPWFRHEPLAEARETWQGRIEVWIQDVVLLAECDVLAHPGGLFIAVEPAATAEDRVRLDAMLAQEEATDRG